MITETEAEAVVKILLGTHDGCIVCSRKLCQKFVDEFPRWRTTVTTMWKMEHSEYQLYVDSGRRHLL